MKIEIDLSPAEWDDIETCIRSAPASPVASKRANLLTKWRAAKPAPTAMQVKLDVRLTVKGDHLPLVEDSLVGQVLEQKVYTLIEQYSKDIVSHLKEEINAAICVDQPVSMSDYEVGVLEVSREHVE